MATRGQDLDLRCERVCECTEELLVSGQVERDDESCEEVVCVLGCNVSLGEQGIAGDNEQG